MRLTTVARMALPSGTVHRYEVQVTALGGAELPVSFDQRRHLGLGPRAGSWMALAFRLPFPASPEQLARAWLAVVDRHGTLRTVVEGPADAPVLRPVSVSAGAWSTPPAGRGEDPREVLRREFDSACCPFAAPSHRLCLVEPDDPAERPCVVVGFDHAHVDAWSLLVVLRDLVTCLDDVVRGLASGAGPASTPAFVDHTRELATRPPAPVWVRARWTRIMADGGGGMPVFPLDLGDVSEPRAEVVEVREVLDDDGVVRLESAARAQGVRMIALVLAEMTRVVRKRVDAPLRAVLPVHSRYDRRWHDSVGWFITNSVVECTSDDPVGCSDAVDEAVRLGSHALEPLLAPWGGMPHTPGMFAVSWLDDRRLPVDIGEQAPLLEPQHVSASILTTGVMVWFVVNAGGLHVRCRYPDTTESRANVGAWLDEVCAGVRERAGLAPAL